MSIFFYFFLLFTLFCHWSLHFFLVNLFFLGDEVSLYVVQAGLELMGSNDPPASGFQSFGIMDYGCEPLHLAPLLSFVFFFFCETQFLFCCPGWSAMAGFRLTATSACQLQVILLSQLPK